MADELAERRAREDEDFATMRRILKPEETRHTELVARMSAQELLDDEATALKYGEIQRRLRTATGAVVCLPEVLEAHARSEYINPTQHGTCNHCQCRMLVYQAGQRYYSLQHSLWMEASGTVYVCATSGQAHVCDGLSCPYARRMDTTGGTMQCTITGVFATAIVYGEDLDDTGTFDPGVLDAGAGEARPRTKRRRALAPGGGVGGRVMDLRQDSDRRAHLRVFIEQLVFGSEYRELLVTRCLQLWSALRNTIISLSKISSSNTHVSALLNDIIDKTMGSTFDVVIWHFGAAFRDILRESAQPQVRTLLRTAWAAREQEIPMDAVTNYFADAIFVFWSLLTTLPETPWPVGTTGRGLPTTLANTVFTAMQMLRDGLCYSVVYNNETRHVVPCIRALNSVRALDGDGTCACQKRMGFGAIDCGIRDSNLWSPDTSRLNSAVIERHGGIESMRVRELWLVPSHALLAALPPDDMAPLLNIDSPFRSNSAFNCHGQVQRALSALFDQRNSALASTTIDMLEERCMHRNAHFTVDRLAGCRRVDTQS